MTLILISLVVLALALTALAILRSREGRASAAEFPGDPGLSAVAPVSRPRAHLEAVVRTGSTVDRGHLSGLWAQERGDHTRIRPKYAKGFQRR
jgi:hypothetical protein